MGRRNWYPYSAVNSERRRLLKRREKLMARLRRATMAKEYYASRADSFRSFLSAAYQFGFVALFAGAALIDGLWLRPWALCEVLIFCVCLALLWTVAVFADAWMWWRADSESVERLQAELEENLRS